MLTPKEREAMFSLTEIALSNAMEGIAAGGTKEQTAEYLRKNFTRLYDGEIDVILRDALVECENDGIEREDIDDSWYR